VGVNVRVGGGVWVGVGEAVLVAKFVGNLVAVEAGVLDGVGDGVTVDVDEDVGLAVKTGVLVAVGVPVKVRYTVDVDVGGGMTVITLLVEHSPKGNPSCINCHCKL